jgi:hypothetical protein
MESIVKVIAIICGIGLPILIVWLDNRKKINETNQRTQIVLAALEKNAETDVEDLLKKMAPTQKKTLLKEKLLMILLLGCVMGFLGIALIGFCIVQGFIGGMPTEGLQVFSFFGVILLAIGIAFLLNYVVGKKMLAKEIEAEQAKLSEQA